MTGASGYSTGAMAQTVFAVLAFFQALATANHNLHVTYGLPSDVQAVYRALSPFRRAFFVLSFPMKS